MNAHAQPSAGSGASASLLAQRLIDCRASGGLLDAAEPTLRPASADEAYAIQHDTLRLLSASVGGWKVGAKSTEGGPIQGAPLPADGVLPGGATLAYGRLVKPLLELEVAFKLGRRFEPQSGPYSDEAVIGAIESVHAAIEVVSSRFRQWPDIDRFQQLADLQNHVALIVGEGVRYDAAWPFVRPSMTFTFEGASAFGGVPANPAGDPRRLLGWIVNHCVSRGLALERGTVLTAGSYTGLYPVAGAGTARGVVEGLPPVQVSFV
ncbi:2-keto-4-pentenoate hydratase [Burkholderia sp. WAC0059]|uniref:2-keto-4-pentenoate hydratase n=1 Tax=Burkholderia sp. WAC0059 TaxID=2066022 RepID=UPI000C7E8F85|nr:2-keto-4-pentenoate hydratase [Burkholderia sp. WAC0059]PLZ02888.1 2-keto-4-pentenoate hydratase [Burkholderia sp. WAC0059]